MKKISIILLVFIAAGHCKAQNFSGQWKGYFTDKQYSSLSFGSSRCDYVLELDCKGTEVTGFSYTYFTEGGVRYYSICKLAGKLDPADKKIVVDETERTKSNLPPQYSNCLQEHTLIYTDGKNGEQQIAGSWKAALPGSNCGSGNTVLVRRTLIEAYPRFSAKGTNNVTATKDVAVAKPKQIVTSGRSPQVKPQPKTTPVAAKPLVDLARGKNDNSKETKAAELPAKEVVVQKDTMIKTPIDKRAQLRTSTLLRTIVTTSAQVKIDIYDNGEVDGDSVTIYFNHNIILDHKMLSEKPITLTLNIEPGQENDVVMYAENLGKIPPNTALMVITDGSKRYEVRITSDLEKSGSLRFKRE